MSDDEEELVSEGSDEDGENLEHEEGTNEEPVHKRALTKEIIAENLSIPYRLGYGFSYAYIKLDCSDKSLFDIEILRGYIHLRFIMLSNNFITDLSPLTEMSNLQYLKVDNNQITSAESLKSSRYLQYLDLSSNKLTTINNLSFPYLQYLKVNDNAIASLKSETDTNLSSEQFPDLHTLELRGNRLSTLSGIDDMINLKTLYCAENLLRRLEGISSLKSLVRLHLRDNRLSKLTDFTENLTSLEYINLRGNQISKFSEVKRLNCLPSLKFLSLVDNPITEKDNYRQMVVGLVNRLQRLDKKRVPDMFRSTAMEFVTKHTEILEQELNEADIIEEHIPENVDDESGREQVDEEDNDYQEESGEDEDDDIVESEKEGENE
ncbi:putative calpain 4, 6, 7, invertebrate [Schistosoma mansoni]|uniref:putative calpain 4, 6, 7, invertebrate n=1 Tax=Schistosoma mansoni TaxID=6183 RepID=UPI0001A9421B|nr:putative calpain 4, 6, 7, invertebrate [Schistosoma mansoni]|eukprot:XP_018647856.1 putative calpain 4, 6, 7, invertebrate [Schistosoma mansoni]